MSISEMARRTVAVACLGGACLGLTGCLIIGTSSEKKATPPTVGQELVDLKAAQEKGAISQEEYESSKQKLLNSVPR